MRVRLLAWHLAGVALVSIGFGALPKIIAILAAKVRGAAGLLLLDVCQGREDSLWSGTWRYICAFWISNGAILNWVRSGRVVVVATQIWLCRLHELLDLLKLHQQVILVLHIRGSCLVDLCVVRHEMGLCLLGLTTIHVVLLRV